MKRKIAFFITNLEGGGAEKVLVDIVNSINADKFDITLVLLKKKGVHLNKVRKDITIKNIFSSNRILGAMSYRFLRYLPKIYYKLKIKEKYDVEVAFLEGLPTKLISASNNIHSKKIAWVHIDLIKEHWTKKYYDSINDEKESYKKFNEIIFVSEDSKQAFNKLFSNLNIKERVIYNPILIDDVIEKSKERNVKFEEFTIISVGRLHKQKGFYRLIKVHSELCKKYPHKLIILGEGPERNKLENEIKELGVKNSVELKGFVSNPYPYIKAADLYISSSISEGHPLVILEAVALEKAIIGTRISGTREILKDGECGILCESTEDGIKQALEYVLSNDNVIKKLENKSKKRKKDFNYRENIREIERLLEE
ncbi:glycosyltransferase [Candidatus Clostridium helianthi]|uniref:Glycosyltransferase n=1 Tax=Candidatus Clostridium helianthi TaxID=3381660 RepID=A0ABW8S0C4_9CLOT